MKVTFIIVAYNAQDTIENILQNLKEQTYNHNCIEVILVDSNSGDNTKKIMEKFKNSESNFYRVCVLDNLKKTLPCGWNVALEEATGDIILRVDAHTIIPNDFIEKNVDCINSGENICGGKVTSILSSKSKIQESLLIAENSALGGGIAKFRRSKKREYVNTLAFAAYRKDVFDKVGKYNELLSRTEDNEMHYRMKKEGYEFCLDPSINSKRLARNSLKKLLKQKFLNGYWIGITMGVEPRCFSIYHLIPFLFVSSIIIAEILRIAGFGIFLNIILGSYTVVNISLAVLTIKNNKPNLYNFFLPIIFFLMHVYYGVGTLIGLIYFPIWKMKNKQI